MKTVKATLHLTKSWFMDHEIEVSEDATDDEIRRQLQRKALRMDPDDPRWQKPQLAHAHMHAGEFEVESD